MMRAQVLCVLAVLVAVVEVQPAAVPDRPGTYVVEATGTYILRTKVSREPEGNTMPEFGTSTAKTGANIIKVPKRFRPDSACRGNQIRVHNTCRTPFDGSGPTRSGGW